MFTDAIEIAVAALGLGLVVLSVRQARAKGWAASLQMAAGGFLLMGASAIGIVGFIAGLVFSPVAWIGVGLLAVAGLLFVTGQKLEVPKDSAKPGAVGESGPAPKGAVDAGPKRGTKQQQASSGDPELDDIEAILRRHGIQ
ncbi:hypothetical protein E1212_22665 [Jiangella ureilytica]|uniref:Uncharacterized protein n=1 Tax=Jiangella ureilytica TaxID=2530374 RepID=A0A4R4RFC1_9ACTN|nr:hypothetical protein [Jiangella ureilytica]TDC47997.1 hypothetical protein E1212_22665 [Jiangella ureilytica]